MKEKSILPFSHLCKPFLLLILFVATGNAAFSQTTNIRGAVTDENGNAIQGASVNVKGTQGGTITDSLGHYNLRIPGPKGSVLVFSFVGYTTQEVPVNAKRSLNITLRTNASDLNEIVVVGYGSQKNKDITAAISTVSAKQIAQRQPINVLDALQGQVPGVVVAQQSGRPGATSSIRIRGTGTLEGGADPLYIVDGAQGVDIDGINPNDIESVTVLRDAASAAIYGSAGGNGVIIITTKKGIAGKPRVSLQYLTSFGNLSRKVPQANAALRRLYDLKRSSSGTNPVPADSLNPGYNADNDYQDLLTQTAVRNQGDLSISGGAKGINYYGSFGLIKDKGLIINSWADIARARFNVDFKPNEKFELGTHIQALYQRENRINEGNTLGQAIQRPPNFRVYFQDGTLAGLIGGRRNPVAEALLDKNNWDIYNASINNFISYNFLPDLKFTVNSTVSFNYTHNLVFTPKLVSSANPLNNSLDDETDLNTYWQAEGFLNYNKTIARDHTITAVLGVSAESGFEHTAEQSGTNLVTETVLTLNSTQIKNPAVTDETRYFKNSGFARLSYSYKGKYLFNSNFRADASSRFGKDNKWGFFPSASVGWRFSDESFMDWTKNVLDDGKFRVSYGAIGNDNIGPYNAIQTYTFGSNYYNGVSGVAPNSTFGNTTLAWESVNQLDAGVDLTFLNGRLNFTADYYDKVTKNLLYSAPLSSNTGYGTVKVNVGSIENKGLEFVVGGYPVRNHNLSWNISYNMSFNNNTVKQLYGGTTILPSSSGTNVWRVTEGGRLGDFYGYEALGVYAYDQSNAWTPDWVQLTPVFDNNNVFTGYTLNGKAYTGDVKQLTTNGLVSKGGDMIWQDTNHDGIIDDADRIVLGNAQPKWIAGLSNLVNYKQFTLSFGFYISWGGSIYNQARADLNAGVTTNVTPEPDFIKGTWWHQGDVTIYPSSKKTSLGNNRDGSSLYLEDASFIRLRNARLSYELPPNLASKIKLGTLSVFIYGNNLLTWTKYSWYDPEIDLGSALTPGLDNGRYPRKREIGGGININF